MKAWKYGVILPLAGGVTLGLAVMTKAVVTTEIIPQRTDRIQYGGVVCGDFRVDNQTSNFPASRPAPLSPVPIDLYIGELPPARLEPDKTCHLHNKKPKQELNYELGLG